MVPVSVCPDEVDPILKMIQIGQVPKRPNEHPAHAVHYEPPAGYGLDVELYRDPELRKRARDIRGRLERIDFHVLLYTTRGGYQHVVDFEPFQCRAGSLLLLRPGQIHRFGNIENLRGWLLIFRAELLPPNAANLDFNLASELESLPTHVTVAPRTRASIEETLQRMAADAKGPASAARNALLLSQMQSVMTRVYLESEASASPPGDKITIERFQRFRAAVEREHHRWHSVRSYARHLGCSERSLTRAARAITAKSAKEYLSERIVLEAKRLLAHTTAPVARISDELGFDEPTNFIKFFRNTAGVTPGAFRRRQQGISAA
jgi:AraC-like DNA-binding protein